MGADDGADERQEVSGGIQRTIFALSSGSPPAGIAVIRISGANARSALQAVAGTLPPARRASYRALKHPTSGETLDNGVVLWLPVPNSATGEDTAELHIHGGRAVVAAIMDALTYVPNLVPAEPGEFTRRAFENGRIDLAEAEGLADLLTAETQSQRRAAMHLSGGHLSRKVELWQTSLLAISAEVEALLDFSDEDDVTHADATRIKAKVDRLSKEIRSWLGRPAAERLKDGITVAIAGPVNAGKSSLINALAQREVAIASPIEGTTRDLVEAPVALGGIAFRLIDTAGLRESADTVEQIGVERARSAIVAADLVLWLGDAADDARPSGSIAIVTKADLGAVLGPDADVLVSSKTGEGISGLIEHLVTAARRMLPVEGEVSLNARHRRHLTDALCALTQVESEDDLILIAEHLRVSRSQLDAITGRAGVEDMLDTLFGRFCIGK